ncbi:DNA translocase FtsK 4TM domain-containing protein [Litorimonas sp. RW-G-Af-16]|uniref:FtsK/SpoIIIE family DNA translocase n=1 Tax=Litorimonas sp. RW-G-Af-16 TaxID=3241168 RepID=UPI00390C5DC5
MTPPPSATANSEDYGYAPEDIHAMMEEIKRAEGGTFMRAVWALGMIAVGFFIFVCVWNYNPFDVTADTAGLSQQHVFGTIGAAIANLLMQMLGWGSYLIAGLLMFSGIRRIFRNDGRQTKMDLTRRILIAASVVFFGAATLSAVPIPQSWPMAAGLGGWIGDTIHLSVKSILDGFNVPLAGAIIALLTFLISGFGLARYVRIVPRDLVDMLDAAGLVWAYIRIWVDKTASFLVRLFRRGYTDDLDQPAAPLHRDIPDAPASAAPTPVYTDPAPVAAAPKPKKKRKVKKPKAPEFDFSGATSFVLPGLDLLKMPPPRSTVHDQAALERSAENLQRVMGDYGIEGEMGSVRPGPVVTLFEFEPAPGVKSQRVINLSDDIARNMSAQSARIAVVAGRNAMGIEMPNRKRETVWLRDMLASDAFQNSDASLPLILGEDIGGAPFVTDLAKMPHLLVAGTTGSGKSVAVNAMILSLMYKLTPDQCKFIMIDPKMLELSVYDGAPHLLAPVVTEPKKAVVALKWTVREMEDRYRKMAKVGVRNMAGFNEKVAEFKARGETLSRTVMTGYNKETGEPEYETEEMEFEAMPYIVVIIDEMADLMMVAKKDIEGSVQRLAQMARAAGIHVIVATQRPSVDVITGTIKANFPTRISFRVGSKIDSRTILGEQGGEQLLGNGDMLFMGTGRPRRYHGPFVSDGEVENIAKFVKAQGAPSYLEDITTDREEAAEIAKAADGGGETSLFDQAVAIVARDRKASTSYIQRKLSIGYNRAADLIEQMEQEGMISESGSGGKREIFLPESDGY